MKRKKTRKTTITIKLREQEFILEQQHTEHRYIYIIIRKVD